MIVRRRSPPRPACGYNALEPTQMVLAILAVTDEATAERVHQRFQWSFIAPSEAGRWTPDSGDVLGWLGSAAVTGDIVRPLAVEES